MKHKIAIKRPGEPLEVKEIEAFYRCDVKPYVNEGDTTLQYVILKQEGNRVLCFACDEDGMFKNLPSNFDLLTQSGSHSFLSKVLGTAVFLVYELEDVWDHEVYDFEIRDLTDADLEKIHYILSERMQENSRRIAKMDPHIHTGRSFIFEPIKDMDSLFPPPSSLAQIPSFLIPTYLFHNFKCNSKINFFSDAAGKQEYEVGIKSDRCPRRIIMYCESKTSAQGFSIAHELDVGITEQQMGTYLGRFLRGMFDMGLPALLYVTPETKEAIFSKEK